MDKKIFLFLLLLTFFIIGCVILLCIGGWFVNRQIEYNKSEEAAIEFLNDFYDGIEIIEITDIKKYLLAVFQFQVM